MRIPESLRAMGTDGFRISSLLKGKRQPHKEAKKQSLGWGGGNPRRKRKSNRSPDFDDVELVEALAVDLGVERGGHPANTREEEMGEGKRKTRLRRRRGGNDRDERGE
jgi:hypothetical protein